MIYVVKYVFQIKKINKDKYHTNVNINLMKENVMEINGGILINVVVRVKNVKYMIKIMHGILLHVVLKMEKI